MTVHAPSPAPSTRDVDSGSVRANRRGVRTGWPQGKTRRECGCQPGLWCRCRERIAGLKLNEAGPESWRMGGRPLTPTEEGLMVTIVTPATDTAKQARGREA